MRELMIHFKSYWPHYTLWILVPMVGIWLAHKGKNDGKSEERD
jgi:hypothetical protein